MLRFLHAQSLERDARAGGIACEQRVDYVIGKNNSARIQE
jgi:hypothetical protein